MQYGSLANKTLKTFLCFRLHDFETCCYYFVHPHLANNKVVLYTTSVWVIRLFPSSTHLGSRRSCARKFLLCIHPPFTHEGGQNIINTSRFNAQDHNPLELLPCVLSCERADLLDTKQVSKIHPAYWYHNQICLAGASLNTLHSPANMLPAVPLLFTEGLQTH